MIERVRLRNFRCHRDLELDGAARVNILTGANSSGKSSLLEAIFLVLGPERPEGGFVLNNLRRYPPSGDAEQFWGPLFFNFDCSEDIELEVSTAAGGHKLCIGPHRDKSQMTLELANGSSTSSEGVSEAPTWAESRVMSWRCREPGGVETAHNAQVVQEGAAIKLKISPPSVTREPVGLLLVDPGGHGGSDVAERFAKAQARSPDFKDEVLAAMRLIEPSVVDILPLPVGAGGGGNYVLHLRLSTLDHVIPLPFAGSGMNWLLNLLPSFPYAANGGVVLFDEVERGLHYKLHAKGFRAIYNACAKSGTQAFMTTHSKEFLLGVSEALKAEPGMDVKVFRLNRSAESTRCVVYDPQEIVTAMEGGVEVR